MGGSSYGNSALQPIHMGLRRLVPSDARTLNDRMVS
jgi:hypothetical protein